MILASHNRYIHTRQTSQLCLLTRRTEQEHRKSKSLSKVKRSLFFHVLLRPVIQVSFKTSWFSNPGGQAVMISNIYGQIFAIPYYYFVYTTWKVTIFSNSTLHCIEDRGAFCQFPFWWIYYCHSSESTGKETGKKHLCALLYLLKYSTYTFQLKFENTLVSLDR